MLGADYIDGKYRFESVDERRIELKAQPDNGIEADTTLKWLEVIRVNGDRGGLRL